MTLAPYEIDSRELFRLLPPPPPPALIETTATVTSRVVASVEARLSNRRQRTMPYFGAYVSEAGAWALSRYSYKGRDDSIMLNYITNPWYSKWVTWFPEWLAPNIITLIGFAFTASSHMFLLAHCPLLEGPIPAWLCVYNALAILAYQAFDAMDGKQARRTGEPRNPPPPPHPTPSPRARTSRSSTLCSHAAAGCSRQARGRLSGCSSIMAATLSTRR